MPEKMTPKKTNKKPKKNKAGTKISQSGHRKVMRQLEIEKGNIKPELPFEKYVPYRQRKHKDGFMQTLDKETYSKIVNMLGAGIPQKQIADYYGIDKGDFADWFAHEILTVRADRFIEVANKLYESAMAGNFAAIKMYYEYYAKAFDLMTAAEDKTNNAESFTKLSEVMARIKKEYEEEY